MPLEQLLLLDRMRAIRADNFYGLIIKDALRELERLLSLRTSERDVCAAQIAAMWQEYKAAHPSYRTEYQDGYLDALDAAEQRLKGPNAKLT